MIRQLYRFLHPRFQTLFLEYKVDFKPRYGHGHPPHPELYSIINARRASYTDWIEKMLQYRQQIWSIRDRTLEKDPRQPVWNNGFLPGLDIISIYTMLAEYKPATYIEIGSGNSTKVSYKAKNDLQLDTRIISIDPQPRAEIDQLADQIIRQPFENTDLDIVGQLQENDILFIDNSHRILPNSDAMVFFLEVLPRLRKGVIVHVHDIYLPYDYPQDMCDRGYSEQYGLAMYILAHPGKYETLLPNYFISQDPELAAVLLPVWQHENLQGVERHGGSYWIRIQGD